MAIVAATPESMWSIRCLSGCSTSMAAPGSSALSSSRSVAMISCRLRLLWGLTLRMYSLEETGMACSSSSARPVRRTKESNSRVGSSAVARISFSLRSMILAASLDACSDEPGGRPTFTCTLPSSKSGRKLAFMPDSTQAATQPATTSQVSTSSAGAHRMLKRIRNDAPL
jgi:hypothetical protein